MDLVTFIFHFLSCVIILHTLHNLRDIYGEVVTSKARARRDLAGHVMMRRHLFHHNSSRSHYHCLAECDRDERCVSFFYSKPTRQCQGHSVTFGSTEGSLQVSDARYWVLPKGERYVGDACVTTTDCVTSNTECRDGACLCIPGYSFSPRTGECLDSCSAYGHDFLEVRDHFLSKTNYDTINNVTLDECFDACLGSIGFECLSLEYMLPDQTCYLANVTKLDFPNRWFRASDYNFNITYYQRDCE